MQEVDVKLDNGRIYRSERVWVLHITTIKMKFSWLERLLIDIWVPISSMTDDD